MKKMRSFYFVMTIIWGVAMLIWIGCLVKAAQGGAVEPLQAVVCICSVVCFVVNLLIYFKLGKKEQ